MKAGIGTHIDAPLHCFEGKKDVASLPLSNLIAPTVVIDVSHKAHESYALSVSDIEEFESKHGLVQAGTFVLCYTGWGKKWRSPEEYRNERDGFMYFPHISIEAAQVLVEKNICGIGLDTPSPDNATGNYPVHGLLLSHNTYIVENVAYVDNLPATDNTVIIAPLAISGATESPVRMFVLRT